MAILSLQGFYIGKPCHCSSKTRKRMPSRNSKKVHLANVWEIVLCRQAPCSVVILAFVHQNLFKDIFLYFSKKFSGLHQTGLQNIHPITFVFPIAFSICLEYTPVCDFKTFVLIETGRPCGRRSLFPFHRSILYKAMMKNI